jgi:glycerol-3-phosphate cytidylyltransferase
VSSARRIVYTAGVWDLFHVGHANVLERSRKLGDVLIVGVLTDLGAAAYKPEPPVWNEHVRLEMVRSLDFVSAAFLQPGTDPSPVLRSLCGLGLCPHVMTHGDDWTELREGNETLVELGIELELLPYTPGVSTTTIRTMIEERYAQTTEVAR